MAERRSKQRLAAERFVKRHGGKAKEDLEKVMTKRETAMLTKRSSAAQARYRHASDVQRYARSGHMHGAGTASGVGEGSQLKFRTSGERRQGSRRAMERKWDSGDLEAYLGGPYLAKSHVARQEAIRLLSTRERRYHERRTKSRRKTA